jgi:hypothetical protein
MEDEYSWEGIRLDDSATKLHRLHKSANTTKCTPPCACVLAFYKHFSRRYVSSQLDPNAYAQDIDLVALDSRANRDCPS